MRPRPFLSGTASLAAAVLLFSSCDALSDGQQGRLTFHFAGYPATKSAIPDTSNFLLKISDSEGRIIYNGVYSQSPEAILVRPGAYTVTAISEEFSVPQFSCPVYGDSQCVVVPPGGTQDVRLECSQINAGIRLEIKPNFLTSYPDGVLMIQGESGRLVYGYTEKRIAYFPPGEVSLVLDEDGKQETLIRRTLREREILSLGVSAPGKSEQVAEGGRVGIAVDTSRIWTNEEYTIGGVDAGRGSSPETALDIASARQAGELKGVWVQGHIVGVFKTATQAFFDAPFPSSTNLVIASRASVTSTSTAMSVELKKGALRDALNLESNPELHGRKVLLKGDLVSAYFGIPGLKNVSDFELR